MAERRRIHCAPAARQIVAFTADFDCRSFGTLRGNPGYRQGHDLTDHRASLRPYQGILWGPLCFLIDVVFSRLFGAHSALRVEHWRNGHGRPWRKQRQGQKRKTKTGSADSEREEEGEGREEEEAEIGESAIGPNTTGHSWNEARLLCGSLRTRLRTGSRRQVSDSCTNAAFRKYLCKRDVGATAKQGIPT